MKYEDKKRNREFERNMRNTAWSKLFPHWWTIDDFTKAIGEEIERVKAQIIFAILNLGIKPPVLLWQRAIDHKHYIKQYDITEFPKIIEIESPKYKTWGKITIINNGDYDIHDLKIMFDNTNGITITNIIAPEDKLVLDLESQRFSLNNKEITPHKHGQGLPYFITSAYGSEHDKENKSQSNEILRIQIDADNEHDVDLDVTLDLYNAVFTVEQNIEITSIELLPIDKVDLYVEYDFPFRKTESGWRLAYTKQYQEETNVIYDMITTQLNTKKFYVEVFFRELEYPYKVGFPCYKDAEEDSMYHVNNRLDVWGKILSLPRREYKTNINEIDYPYTFPIFYPFDIEQDFWYYSRLVNEYCWNENAINEVDLIDTQGHNVMRLHSINPFVEDFAIHARTVEPTERENINYNFYIPQTVTQVPRDVNIDLDNSTDPTPFIDIHPHNVSEYFQSEFIDIENLLDYSDDAAKITLYNKIGKYITYNMYKSQELDLFFNLSNLPEHVNIEGFEFTIDAESTDNLLDKYNDVRTRVELRSLGETIFSKSVGESGQYQLRREEITYGGKDILFDFDDKIINKKIGDKHVLQEFTIKPFSGTLTEYVEIPFIFIENDEEIDELGNVSIIYDNDTTVAADYIIEERQYPDPETEETITEEVKLLRAYIPEGIKGQTITIQSLKSETHYPFTVTFDIRKCEEANPEGHEPIEFIEGPIIDDNISTFTASDSWDTGDLRDILQKSGLHFIFTLQNDNETNTPTFIIHNITLKVFYSPKKTYFNLNTEIDTHVVSDDRIANLIVNIQNIGDIPFVSTIDMFNEQNISLSTNSINVNLKPQESEEHIIGIQQTPPLVNGVYDIITLCEDKKRQNTIVIDTEGLIQTTTKTKPVFTQYHNETTFEASVNTVDRAIINEGLIEFYINKILIGTAPVQEGLASLTTFLNDLNIETGFHNLEARYIGSERYAPSRTSSIILISKQQTQIEILSEEYGHISKPYICEAKITSNGIPVTEGSVTFYLNDEELGRPDVDENGIATLSHIFDDKTPCSYTLKAIYNGTVTYGYNEAIKDIILSGGDTEIITYNITGAPTESIILSAQVIQKVCAQSKYNNVQQGQITIQVLDNEDVLYENTLNVNKEGRISAPWTIPEDITIKDYQIKCYYTDDEGLFNDSEGNGILTVQRKNIQLKHQSLFYGSRYEPLGFYIQVYDENNAPVTEGQISITIPSLNITAISDVDSDNSAKIIHNAIDFTSAEWNELERLNFKFGEDGTYYYDNDSGVDRPEIPENLYRIYDNDYHDLQYVNFYITDGNLYYKRESASDEQIYIGNDGHLYARTNMDEANLDSKQYVIGTHDVIVEYIPTNKYNAVTNNSKIKITTPQVDADLHSYHIKYNSKEFITCFITEYSWSPNGNEPINTGSAYFYIDNTFISKVQVQQGRAILPQEALNNITANKHLLSVEYIPENKKAHTFTYAPLTLDQIPSSITYSCNRILKDKNTNFVFNISLPPEYQDMQQSGYIHGNVDILLNNEKINDYYLFGDENGEFETIVKIPDDIDKKEYILSIKYEGTNYIQSSNLDIILEHTPLPTEIESISIQIASNEICDINIPIHAEDNDDISEGIISIEYDNQIITQTNVIHNNAPISFNIGTKDNGQYTYIIKYQNSINYADSYALLYINVISPMDKIYLATYGNDASGNGSRTYPFKTLERALTCLSDNGEIYILDKINITQSIVIDKNIYINGDNGSQIIKDLNDLLQNNNDIYNSLHIYNTTELPDTLYEINDLKIQNLNINEFSILNKELYFLQGIKLIPIYLYDNGKFYSETPLSIQDVNSIYSITNNKNLKINNIIFKSNDNTDITDFMLINNGKLEIYHSIIESNILIDNFEEIKINRNLIYGDINERIKYNLDNNWWGNNTVSHETNNNIIAQLTSDVNPPVLGEDFEVIVEMIGENGKHYDIPQLEVLLTADTGYFQTPSGVFNNQKFSTLYADATQEGKIYAEIDNEKIDMDVYNYDRKTEIILDSAIEFPIGYQIPIQAKIQSCADIFYQFDDKCKIINQTNDINNGKVVFYLDDIQVGQAYVRNGIAEISIFFSINKYEINHSYKLSAHYIPDKYYFDSYSEKDISLISEDNICFVSPDGNNANEGTFLKPFQTITSAILSNKDTIYLKDGYYRDSHIIIPRDVTIKKYNNYAIFQDNNNENINIFNINNDINVILDGLDFIDNNCNNIINCEGHLTINECLFYNNQMHDCVINNENAQSLNIYRSAIVNNNIIVNNVNKINNLQYCWFGTNTPNDESCIPNYNINDYVIMDTIASKDVIYIGTIARITARLQIYQHDDEIFALNRALPLRVAIFESDSGLLMPLKDYTYHNQSTSLFNSNDISNSDKIFLSLPDNTNYINEPLILKCNVTNAVGRNIDEGSVTFIVTDEHKKIRVFTAFVSNGVATVYQEHVRLNAGQYNLQCYYIYKENEIYSTSGTFTIQKPNIIINNCQLHNITPETMQIYASDIYDSLNQIVYNQKVYIYVDNELVKNDTIDNIFYINNGILSALIYYSIIEKGNHILTITTTGLNSQYEELIYKKTFNVDKYNTHIDFPYTEMPKDREFDLTFYVLDANKNSVKDGYVDVYCDNILIAENYQITNGICIIPDFKITERGQHSFYINYYGDEYYYHDCSYINNNINVNLYEVIIDSEELQKQLNINVHSNLELKFQIKDILNKIVNIGYVNMYIDGVKINNDEINFINDYINVNLPLPTNTAVGRHDFTIEYIDENDIYIDTTLDTYLYISQIPVNIIVDNVTSTISTDKIVSYDIQSSYGNVTTGMLTVYLNNTQIGTASVANTNIETITLHIPKVTIGQYDLVFKYTDNMGNYQTTTETKILNIAPKPVDITTSHDWYYPNKDFSFVVNIQDNDGEYVNNGKACIYIDNIQETEKKNIQYGECDFILRFDKVQDYNLTIVYTDDQYYQSTTYKQIFKVSALPIINIDFEEPLTSVANTEYNNTIIFETFEDHHVYDGIIDIFLNNNKMGTYYITDTNKEFIIEIDDIDAGVYDFTIQYHDSELFDDFESTFDFTIEERTLNMIINNGEIIVAQLKEQISIPVNTDLPAKGLIKYYMGINEDNMKFIGVTDINGTYTEYNYTLPKTLDNKPIEQPYYLIKCVFENNGKYQESTAYGNLDIILTTPELNIEPITAFYHDNINIIVTNDIDDNEMLEFYINNEYIGSEVSNDGMCVFSYTLPSKYTAGEYNLMVKHDKTAVIDEATANTTLTIEPCPIRIKSDNIEQYINNIINIHALGIDNQDRTIPEGTMSFSINDTEVEYEGRTSFNMNENIQYQLPINVIEDTEIQVTYHSANIEKYQNTISYIPLHILKHKLNIQANNIQKYARGDVTDINIILSSNTIDNFTNIPIDAQISSPSYNLDTEHMIYDNNPISLQQVLSKELGDYESYDLMITITDADVFEDTERHFSLPIQNKDMIYVNANNTGDDHTGDENDPVPTLSEAIDLVCDNGNIVILSSNLIDTEININKNINIINDNTVECSNTIFNVNKKLLLNNFLFTEYDNNIFNNNGELTIKDSTFEDNNAQCIINNNKLSVDNCIFNRNASDESGTCISIKKNNIHTSVTNCSFNENYARVKGSCIDSIQGNDVTIQGNYFGENNTVDGDGTYISTYGNMKITDNIFYQCDKSAIYILDGIVQIELNIFHNDIDKVINNINGTVTANMCYWGNNILLSLENKWNGNVILDTYLLADYSIDSSTISTSSYITGHINKYISKDEAETYEFDFNDFIHHKVDVELYKNNEKIKEGYIDERIELEATASDDIVINIFGNNIEVIE